MEFCQAVIDHVHVHVSFMEKWHMQLKMPVSAIFNLAYAVYPPAQMCEKLGPYRVLEYHRIRHYVFYNEIIADGTTKMKFA